MTEQDLTITGMRVRVVEPPDFVFQWREDIAPIQLTMTVFEIETDAGITGVSTSWLPAAPREIAETADHFFRPVLIGANALDRGRLWLEMMSFARYLISPKAASNIDIALWDIAGKAFGQPIHRLLGTVRESMPVYVTTQTASTPEEFAELARAGQARGLRGVKLKGSVPDVDIAAIALARETVGADYTLLFDATSAYDYQDALRVGRALERHGFHWYEDPMRDDDIEGYRRLTAALDIPVIMGEATMLGPWTGATYLAEGMCDAVRGVGDLIGGITGLVKLGANAELHNRRMEPHSYGSTLVQAAHLHYMLSVSNCEWFELPDPREVLDFGMRDVLEVTPDGMVHAPAAPGLGFEVDWDVIDDATIAEYR